MNHKCSPEKIAVDIFGEKQPCRKWLTKKQTKWIRNVEQEALGSVPVGREISGYYDGFSWRVRFYPNDASFLIVEPFVEPPEETRMSLEEVDYPMWWMMKWLETNKGDATKAFRNADHPDSPHWQSQVNRLREINE